MIAATTGTAAIAAAMRNHFFRHARCTPTRSRARRLPLRRDVRAAVRVDLDGDNPVGSKVERQLLEQTFNERRPVLVQEGDESDRTLLRRAAGKRERLRTTELTAQCLVTPLRRLNRLVMKRLEIVLHAAER